MWHVEEVSLQRPLPAGLQLCAVPQKAKRWTGETGGGSRAQRGAGVRDGQAADTRHHAAVQTHRRLGTTSDPDVSGGLWAMTTRGRSRRRVPDRHRRAALVAVLGEALRASGRGSGDSAVPSSSAFRAANAETADSGRTTGSASWPQSVLVPGTGGPMSVPTRLPRVRRSGLP